MIICKPYAEYWENTNNIAQIARAAKLCYASQIKEDESIHKFIEDKWDMGHRSIFRHGTRYFVTPTYSRASDVIQAYFKNPFLTIIFAQNYCFISTNNQFYREELQDTALADYEVSEKQLIEKAKIIGAINRVARVLRRTVLVQTQISTSRELNRTSPNNICEQSTRYCNFTKEKFNGDVRICEPHWLKITNNELEGTIHQEVGVYVDTDDNIFIKDLNTNTRYDTSTWPIATNEVKGGFYNHDAVKVYIIGCNDNCLRYNQLVNNGFLPQDARGILPVDTATKVVYTYSLKEWKHILDLRYYGVTGAPHPNAKIAANLIRLELNKSQDFIKFVE